MVPSAFEIARSIGFSGTEADFVKAASLNQNFFSLLKGNNMDNGQTDLSFSSGCACGSCTPTRNDSGKINLDHPLLKMLAETTPGLNLSASAEYNPYNPPGYADRAVAQTERRMLPALTGQNRVTEQSLLEKGKEAMSQTKSQHPSPEGFMEFLGAMLGAEGLAELNSELAAEFGLNLNSGVARAAQPRQANEGIVPQYLQDILRQSAGAGRAVAVPQVFPISEEIKEAAKDETLQGYITNKMIPSFLVQLTELLGKYEGQERLRQQRRVIARLAKLMQYQAKPETIVPQAIHDEFELAIYKHTVAKQIVYRNIPVQTGVAQINAAIEAMNERTITQQENTKRQEEATREEKMQRIVDDALECLANDSSTTHLGDGLNYLRGLALRTAPENSTEKQISERVGVLLDRLSAIVLNKQRTASPAVQAQGVTRFQPGMGGVTPNMQAGGDTGLYQTPIHPFAASTTPARGLMFAGHRDQMTQRPE
jgi:hypothetical protein